MVRKTARGDCEGKMKGNNEKMGNKIQTAETRKDGKVGDRKQEGRQGNRLDEVWGNEQGEEEIR